MKIRLKKAAAFVATNLAALAVAYAIGIYFSYLIVPIEKPYEIRIKYRQYPGYYKAEPGRYENPKYGVTFTINSKGFRGPEFEAKRGRALRIVALGESSTMGLESPDDETWPARLQRYLDAKRASVEVVNCGIAGHSSPHNRAMFEQEILSYEPNLVVYYAGHNDHHVGNIERYPGPKIWPPKMSFWRHWFIFKRIQARLIGLQLFGLDIEDYVGWSNSGWTRAFRTNLDAMVREARAARIPFVIVTQVQDYSPDLLDAVIRGEDRVRFARRLSLRYLSWHLYLRQMDVLRIEREIASTYGVPVIDLHPAFAEAAKPGTPLFYDYIHPTPAGNDVIAHALAPVIRERYLSHRAAAPGRSPRG